DRQVGLAAIGVGGDETLTAAGGFQFEESFAADGEVLGGRGFFQRQETLSVGAENFGCGSFVAGSQLYVRINREIDWLLSTASAEIGGGLLNKRNPGGVEGKIVGELVECRGEAEDLAFADLAFEDQRGAVVQSRENFRFRGCDFDGLVELHAIEAFDAAHHRMAGVDFGDGEESLAFAAGVCRSLDRFVEERYARQRCRGWPKGYQHRSTGSQVFSQRFIKG